VCFVRDTYVLMYRVFSSTYISVMYIYIYIIYMIQIQSLEKSPPDYLTEFEGQTRTFLTSI
jgi:hypothetical protein